LESDLVRALTHTLIVPTTDVVDHLNADSILAAGYKALLGWLHGFGDVELAGVEGTGSFGADLTRYLLAEGVASRWAWCRFRDDVATQPSSVKVEPVIRAYFDGGGSGRSEQRLDGGGCAANVGT